MKSVTTCHYKLSWAGRYTSRPRRHLSCNETRPLPRSSQNMTCSSSANYVRLISVLPCVSLWIVNTTCSCILISHSHLKSRSNISEAALWLLSVLNISIYIIHLFCFFCRIWWLLCLPWNVFILLLLYITFTVFLSSLKFWIFLTSFSTHMCCLCWPIKSHQNPRSADVVLYLTRCCEADVTKHISTARRLK